MGACPYVTRRVHPVRNHNHVRCASRREGHAPPLQIDGSRDKMGRRESGGPVLIPGHGASTNLEHRHSYGRGMLGGICRGEACLSRCPVVTQRREGQHNLDLHTTRREPPVVGWFRTGHVARARRVRGGPNVGAVRERPGHCLEPRLQLAISHHTRLLPTTAMGRQSPGASRSAPTTDDTTYHQHVQRTPQGVGSWSPAPSTPSCSTSATPARGLIR